MKTILKIRGKSKINEGVRKVVFSGTMVTTVRGTPPISDECFRLLEDGFQRILENGDFRILEICGEDSEGFDYTLDFTF